MGSKHWAVALILVILATIVKAHVIFMRLVVLAAAGLLGLFLLHILAGDYRKIQAGRPKVLGLFKRSIDAVQGSDIDTQFSLAQRHLEEINQAKIGDTNHLSLLGAAAYLDPNGCARRYVCSIAARRKDTLTAIEKAVMDLIENSQRDAAPLQDALRMGRKLRDIKSCAARFPRCTFSVTEMLRLIQPAY